MPDYDFRTTRLYIDAPLGQGRIAALERGQAHYLTTVLRLKSGDSILVFNGRDGEWRAQIEGGTRDAALRIGARLRAQTAAGDLHYLFAPLKSARLDYMVQKAVEMGAAHLRRTHPARPGGARQSRAYARQCDRGGGAMRHSCAAADRGANRT